MTMYHFDQVTTKVFDNVKAIAIKNASSFFYVIRDIWGRFSIYLEDSDSDIASILGQSLLEYAVWINRVQCIKKDDFIYPTIKKEMQHGILVDGTNNLYFSEAYQTNSYWSGKHQFESRSSLNTSKIVSFYSFKGGVGRTTLMVLSAINLVRRGKRVVLVDFDLEAPGVSSLLSDDNLSSYGVADFLIEASIYKNDPSKLDIDDYIYSIKNSTLIGGQGGELYVVPAFGSTCQNGTYTEKLMRLDLNMPGYYEDKTPIDILLDKISKSFEPDYIFIDARSGIHQVGGITISRYSNMAVLCFYGNKQNVDGMKAVIPAIDKQNIPFILVNVQKPTQRELAEREIEYYIKGAYDALKLSREEYQNEEIDLENIEADHYPVEIPYMSEAILLDSAKQLSELYDKSESYTNKIADLILDPSEQNINIINTDDSQKGEILDALRNLIPLDNWTPAAEDEFKSENDLISKFYPLQSYNYIFDPRKFLVLGSKGAGKSALFTVLRYPNYAKSLARYIGVDTKNYEKTTWITGLGETDRTTPTATIFVVVGRLDEKDIRAFWYISMFKKLLDVEPDLVTSVLRQEDLSFIEKEYSDIISAIQMDMMIGIKMEEALIKLDQICMSHHRKLVFIYDALDKLIPNSSWGAIISPLVSIWYGFIHRVQNVQCKIFLRTDIFNNYIQMTDKVKLNNYSSNVRWTYDQLFALVWKRIAFQSTAFIKLTNQQLESSLLKPLQEDVELGIIPIGDELINKSILSWLVGENMGSGNKAYTYNWFRTRLSDTNDIIVPRSMIDIFSEAARSQKKVDDISKSLSKNVILKPRSLEEALPAVSVRRVTDLKNEYEEYKDILNELKTLVRTPIEEKELSDMIGRLRPDAQATIKALCDIGLMRPYKRRKVDDPDRYHIPDIYLHGLGLKRFGTK